MRFLKPVAATMALTVAALTFTSSAEARHRHRHHGGSAAAAGIVGFAAGAILGGALAQPRYRSYDYYEPAPVYRAPPPVVYRSAPVYYANPEPWTAEWYAYCDARYRSFDPSTGLFYGFDGEYHFCR
jgi:MFS family permease